MVYKVFDRTALEAELTYEDLADIVAYAEMYLCLPLIAEQVRECLLAKQDLWQDVKQQPLFHLSLALKLRCPETFADSIRHLAGNGTHFSALASAGMDSGEAAMLLYDLHQELQEEVDLVIARIRQLFMTEYVAHSNTKNPSWPTQTTFLSSNWDTRMTMQQKAEWLAKCACRDWLDQQLYGPAHWSHIRKFKYDVGSPDFHPISLRTALNRIKCALDTKHTSTLLESDLASRLVDEFGLRTEAGPTAGDIINSTVASLLRSIMDLAKTLMDGKIGYQSYSSTNINDYTSRCDVRSHGADDPCPLAGRTHRQWGDQLDARGAKDDKDCCYFTFFKITEDRIPWREEEEWEPFHVDGLKQASEEWLRTLGINVGEDSSSEGDEDSTAVDKAPGGGARGGRRGRGRGGGRAGYGRGFGRGSRFH